MSLAEIMNQGRAVPLTEERAEALFIWLDRMARLSDRRCPDMGPPDMRHPLDKIFARAAASGQPVSVRICP